MVDNVPYQLLAWDSLFDGSPDANLTPSAECFRLRRHSSATASSSSLRSALVAADAACLAVKRAESCLSRAVSLRRVLLGQVKASRVTPALLLFRSYRGWMSGAGGDSSRRSGLRSHILPTKQAFPQRGRGTLTLGSRARHGTRGARLALSLDSWLTFRIA